MTAMPPVSLLRNYARETHQTQDSLTFFHGLPKNPNWSPCFVFPRASTYWSFLWDTHPPPLVVCLFYSWNDSTIEILFLDTWRRASAFKFFLSVCLFYKILSRPVKMLPDADDRKYAVWCSSVFPPIRSIYITGF